MEVQSSRGWLALEVFSFFPSKTALSDLFSLLFSFRRPFSFRFYTILIHSLIHSLTHSLGSNVGAWDPAAISYPSLAAANRYSSRSLFSRSQLIPSSTSRLTLA